MIKYFLALSCVAPAIASLGLYKTADKKNLLFIFTIWYAVFTELFSIAALYFRSLFLHYLNYNIFGLVNLYIFLHLFYLCGLIDRKWIFLLLLTNIFLYAIELITLGKWGLVMRASIISSLIITVGCIEILGRTILTIEPSPLQNGFFVLLVANIILYLFDILNSVIGFIVVLPEELKLDIVVIFRVVNALSYFLMLYGILCLLWNKRSSK